MCFSAQASFIASGVLLSIGILTSFKVKSLDSARDARRLIPLTLIPIFFSIQQFAEGMLWVILTNQILVSFQSLAMYTFLFFAYIFWPIWMPFTLINLETNIKQKKLLLVSLAIGLLVSIGNTIYLLYYGAEVHIELHHICYNTDLRTLPTNIALIIYYLATILPFFITSIKYMRYFGIAITLALIFTYIAYIKYFTSIWCFFGAALSIMVYWIICRLNKNK